MRGASRREIKSVLLKRARELVQRAALIANHLANRGLDVERTRPEIDCAHFQLERPAVALRHEAVLHEQRDVLEHLVEVQVTCLKLALVKIVIATKTAHIKYFTLIMKQVVGREKECDIPIPIVGAVHNGLNSRHNLKLVERLNFKGLNTHA